MYKLLLKTVIEEIYNSLELRQEQIRLSNRRKNQNQKQYEDRIHKLEERYRIYKKIFKINRK